MPAGDDDGGMQHVVTVSSLLKWSDNQTHILTGGGVSSKWYQAPRFPFSDVELPHYHKALGDTRQTFAAWRKQGASLGGEIAGAWRRPLFVGGWIHSDDTSPGGEITFNLQTPSVFLDMRVPKAGAALLGHHKGFDTMTDLELRLFARRHAFAGYTRVAALDLSPTSGSTTSEGTPLRVARGGDGRRGLVATRHHAIDWNYVGKPRPRPNKWRVEMGPRGDTWREWGFAKDAFDQHVYMERWKRLPAGGGPYMALRRRPVASRPGLPDALLVVCGDHFGLIVDRCPELSAGKEREVAGGGSDGLVGLVDDAIARGDRRKAVEFMSLEASHGRISSHGGDLPWTVDCSLHPWLQGRRPFVGTVLAIASDRLSFTLSRPVEPSSGDALITPTSSDNVAGITAGGQRVKAEGVCDEQDNPRWIGVPLDGVWEVVEGASSGGGGPPDALPEGFLRGSGAALVTGKYVSEEQGGGARGDEAFVRAKL